MTQEEKELLLKDLSARLSYGVIVDYKEGEYDFHHWKIDTLHALSYSRDGTLIDTDTDGWISYEEYKGCGMSTGSRPLHIETTLPFLRPLSSMTEEERKELNNRLPYKCEIEIDELGDLYFDSKEPLFFDTELISDIIDWLNKKMFDYRGLIGKGLALEAPEGMYLY
jgi:hypothetical protein